MSEAVADEMPDAIAVAGRPDEVSDRLKEWEWLTEHPLLYPATVGTGPEQMPDNIAAIVDTFGS
jgi:hypothetical protein